jgi:hypothetical protein
LSGKVFLGVRGEKRLNTTGLDGGYNLEQYMNVRICCTKTGLQAEVDGEEEEEEDR